MHCVTLADLAATLSQHGPSLLELRPRVPSATIMRYWTASRSRHELWHRVMSRYRDAKNAGNYGRLADWWSEHRVVLEEILVSELLTRVVAAIGAETAATDGAENHESHESLAAVTHGIYLGQIEASNRVAQIILESCGARVEDTVRLNRLRYGVERWTDWLIGRVSVHRDRSFQYSIDAERSKTFYDEVREGASCTHRDTTTWLMNAAMREMLVRRTSEKSALAHANHEVASSALALFRPELFDDYGVPKSVWLHRLQKNAAKLKPFDFALVSD
ncbi:MAG: hypothetical protein F9B45_25170 [Phycisphaera sp. RhM]|nr:hypothetical protein [Phycisphaera sp. RhM]